MDAGLAGLLGGVIGATVGGIFSTVSAHLTGRKAEQQARIQANSQLEQARMQAQVQLAQAQAQAAQAGQQIRSEHLLQRREARTRVFLEYAEKFQEATAQLRDLRQGIRSNAIEDEINSLDEQLRNSIAQLGFLIARVGLEGSVELRKLCSDMRRWLMAQASIVPSEIPDEEWRDAQSDTFAAEMFESFIALAGAVLETDGVTPVTVDMPTGWGARGNSSTQQQAPNVRTSGWPGPPMPPQMPQNGSPGRWGGNVPEPPEAFTRLGAS
ncbi:hypothetical protein AB0N77_02055 [Streptomyces misionensis]|uniref:hypothetical protein n=1 Tax=Streptomyces misionensis TaxID=67331 RepID=UPI00341C0461